MWVRCLGVGMGKMLILLSDRAIGEVLTACEKTGYVMLVTADHGNAERMLDENGKPVTKHTTFRGKQGHGIPPGTAWWGVKVTHHTLQWPLGTRVSRK